MPTYRRDCRAGVGANEAFGEVKEYLLDLFLGLFFQTFIVQHAVHGIFHHLLYQPSLQQRRTCWMQPFPPPCRPCQRRRGWTRLRLTLVISALSCCMVA